MNTIKSLIPNLFYLIGYVIGFISLGLAKVSLGLYSVGSFLHIVFKTKLGVEMKKYMDTYKQLKKTLTDATEKLATKSNTGKTNGNNRLLTIINGETNNDPSSKV